MNPLILALIVSALAPAAAAEVPKFSKNSLRGKFTFFLTGQERTRAQDAPEPIYGLGFFLADGCGRVGGEVRSYLERSNMKYFVDSYHLDPDGTGKVVFRSPTGTTKREAWAVVSEWDGSAASPRVKALKLFYNQPWLIQGSPEKAQQLIFQAEAKYVSDETPPASPGQVCITLLPPKR